MAIVSLNEIDTYYRESYIPAQKAKGLEPLPMVELLNEIESILKKEKIEKQVVDWIQNLRQKADVKINLEKSGKTV